MIVNAVVKAFSKIFVLPKIVEQIEPLGDVDGEGWFGRPFGSNMAPVRLPEAQRVQAKSIYHFHELVGIFQQPTAIKPEPNDPCIGGAVPARDKQGAFTFDVLFL